MGPSHPVASWRWPPAQLCETTSMSPAGGGARAAVTPKSWGWLGGGSVIIGLSPSVPLLHVPAAALEAPIAPVLRAGGRRNNAASGSCVEMGGRGKRALHVPWLKQGPTCALSAGQDPNVQPVRKLLTSWDFFGFVFFWIAKPDWLR